MHAAIERTAWLVALAGTLGLGLVVGAAAARGDAASREAFHEAVTADAVRAKARDLARARAERDAARAALETANGRAARGGSLAQARAELEALRRRLEGMRADAQSALEEVAERRAELERQARDVASDVLAEKDRLIADLRAENEKLRADVTRLTEQLARLEATIRRLEQLPQRVPDRLPDDLPRLPR